MYSLQLCGVVSVKNKVWELFTLGSDGVIFVNCVNSRAMLHRMISDRLRIYIYSPIVQSPILWELFTSDTENRKLEWSHLIGFLIQ